MELEDLEALLPGSRVMISGCEAREHGDNEGCLCHLKGTIQKVGKKYDSIFVGTPTWHLVGRKQQVRLSEITLVKRGK